MSALVPRATNHIEPPSPLEELHILRRLGLPPSFLRTCNTLAERGEKLRAHLRERRVERVPVYRGADETWIEFVDRRYGSAEAVA